MKSNFETIINEASDRVELMNLVRKLTAKKVRIAAAYLRHLILARP